MTRTLSEKVLTPHPGRVVPLPPVKTFIVTCRRLGGAMSCGHAMKYYGIPLRTSPGVPHITISVQRNRIPDATGRTVVHRIRGLALPEDTQPPMAQVEQALICFICYVDEPDTLITLDAALRLGYTIRAQLGSALSGPCNTPPHSPLFRTCPGARPLPEMIARHGLEQADYRPVVAVMVDGTGEVDLVLSQRPQTIVPGSAEGTYILTTAAYPALLIETDGYIYYSSRSDWHSGHLRDQAVFVRGHTPLRLTSDQVLDRETVRIVSPVARRLGIHLDVIPGGFQVELERGRWEPLPYLCWSTPSSPLADCQ